MVMEGGETVGRTITKTKASNPKNIKLKKVAAYARVSSGKDAMLHSLSAQVSHYSQLIQENPKWEYVGVYADEAITGTKDGREQFQKLLEDCRAGKIDLVLTKSISRFARNTLILLGVVRELKALNVDVYFEKENIHSISGDGELMLTILASFAQAESLSASENCKWRIRKSFAEGELMNFRFMYGYNINKKEIEINEEEASIVRMIFKDYLSGMGAISIAKKLRKLNIERPRGGPWNSEVIIKILRNEKYIGDALLQKRYVKDHISKSLVKNQGELPQYYVENSHPTIIDKETYEEVQKILGEKREKESTKKKRMITYGFTGKVLCKNCGKNYRRKTNNGKVYWGCSTYFRYGKDSCYARKIPETILTELSSSVMNIKAFDEAVLNEKIKCIEVTGLNKLYFVFKNGEHIEKTWEHQSRSESWSIEAREKAREKSIQKWKEMSHANS